MQKVVPTHETALRLLPEVPSFGLEAMVQRAGFAAATPGSTRTAVRPPTAHAQTRTDTEIAIRLSFTALPPIHGLIQRGLRLAERREHNHERVGSPSEGAGHPAQASILARSVFQPGV
jgi:hypothetical protein